MPGRQPRAVLRVLSSSLTQMVKNPPAMQETGVQALGRGDPLEEGMATHSSTAAWRIPWTEEPGGLQSMGLFKRSWTRPSDEHFGFHVSTAKCCGVG